jgi:small subunit ribosomal protein S21
VFKIKAHIPLTFLVLFKNQLKKQNKLLSINFYLYLCTPIYIKKRIKMIIVPIKEGESIDRALKKYKRKFEKTGVVKELRERQKYTKPSVKNRQEKLKAVYVQQLRQQEES